MPKIFPNQKIDNLVICLSGIGAQTGFSALMSDCITNYHTLHTGLCFPLLTFGEESAVDESDAGEVDLFGDVSDKKTITTDGISDSALSIFQNAYKDELVNRAISKQDLFYYIYAIFHSPEYKKRFANNLSKELPRIPVVKKLNQFIEFSDAGRRLSELHVNYENVEPYNTEFSARTKLDSFKPEDFAVKKMKFSSKADKSSVIYNEKITMVSIPEAAYHYEINDKPALEWVMDRQAIDVHKDSGILSDPNMWAIETMHDPAYPLKLFQRVITVSLETMKIVDSLPKLDI